MPSGRTPAAVLLACLQAACATPVSPDHLSDPDKRYLGRIAVVPASSQPEYVFEALTSGKEDAARGALSGVSECAHALRGTRGWVGGLMFLVCAPIGAVAGAVSGASQAASAQEVEAAKAAAQEGIAALALQDATADALLRHAKEMGIALDPSTPANSADSVIEISVLSATAFTPGARDLRVSLGMRARVRAVSTRDGKELDSFTPRCASPLRPVSEWLAAGGAAIKAALDTCAASIAEQALEEVLLVYHPKKLREQDAAGESQRVPAYALRAVEPPLRTKLYLAPSRVTYGHLERYALDSLQPTFRWEQWPRGFDIEPHQVRYDLRIFAEEGLVYERRGLSAPAHRLQDPLAPCQTFRWTVRARFTLAGAPRATEWMGAFDTIGGPVAPWWIRRGSGQPALASIPPSPIPFYPIVETPGSQGTDCPGR